MTPSNGTKRRVLTIIVGDTVEQPQWVLVPGSTEFLTLFVQLMTAELRGELGPGRWRPGDVLLFDWSGRRLPAGIRIGEVPMPGIVIAASRGSRTQSVAESTNVWLFRQTLMLHEKSRDILWRFLSSPDATVVPWPVKEIDVFLSYCFEDGRLAASIARDLQARGQQVFIAESSLSTGRQWRDQIREAVKSAHVAVLLITPASLQSTWVLAEAGACAVQGVPIFVLYDAVTPSDIPAPLRRAVLIEPARQPDRWMQAVTRRPLPDRVRE